MKSKAPLLLMEQMVMLLVFALAAALCMQAFVKSDAVSQECEARDRAVVLCQNAAEAVRHSGGIEAGLTLLYGEAFQQDGVFTSFFDGELNYIRSEPDCGLGSPACVYRLAVSPVDTGVDGLGRARVEVVSIGDGTSLFALDVAWQEEVSAHG